LDRGNHVTSNTVQFQPCLHESNSLMAPRSPHGRNQQNSFFFFLPGTIFHYIFLGSQICERRICKTWRRWITNSSERRVLSIVSRRSLSAWHLFPLSVMHFKVHQSRARRFHTRHWFLLLLSRPFQAWTPAATLATAGPSKTLMAHARCLLHPYPQSTLGWRRKRHPRKTRQLRQQQPPILVHYTSPLKVFGFNAFSSCYSSLQTKCNCFYYQ